MSKAKKKAPEKIEEEGFSFGGEPNYYPTRREYLTAAALMGLAPKAQSFESLSIDAVRLADLVILRLETE